MAFPAPMPMPADPFENGNINYNSNLVNTIRTEATVITRQRLQNLKREVDEEKIMTAVKNVVREIKSSVLSVASVGRTKFVYQNVNRVGTTDIARTVLLVVDELRKIFEGCTVEYIETTNIHGRVIDNGIRVDWS